MHKWHLLAAACLILTFGAQPSAIAQTTSAQITGSVLDPQSRAVPNAKVTLQSVDTNEIRTFNTDDSGTFTFPSLSPGKYKLTVEASGFATVIQNQIQLTASERRSLPISLRMGSVSQSVQVESRVMDVATASSEVSSHLDTKEVGNLTIRGRDPISLLRTLPGVSNASDNDSPAPLGYGTTTPTISGVRNTMNNVTLDGQNNTDADVSSAFQGTVSMDAVSEVKVLLNGFAAEYGRNAGGVIDIVTKSGTKDFHGSLYYYGRNEDFNANNTLNNQTGVPRPQYRYHTIGGTVGGPVFIPGIFNTDRRKLFFFYNYEKWVIKNPAGSLQAKLPTALERAGDFSASGVTVKDPLTGLPFLGNKIPSDRWDPNGLAIMNLFGTAGGGPNVNLGNPGANFNFIKSDDRDNPKTQQQVKIDYKPTERDSVAFRIHRWDQDTRGFNGVFGGPLGTNVPIFYHHYGFRERSAQATYTRVISANIVNELNASIRRATEHGEPLTPNAFDPITRSKVGLGAMPQLFSGNNPQGFIPNILMTIAGGVNNPQFQIDNCGTSCGRIPQHGQDERFIVLDNLSYSRGTHAFKVGMYFERDWDSEGPRGFTNGTLTFTNDVNNPGNTGYTLANVLLGNFTSYLETNHRTTAKNKISLTEWFVQDSWKALPRFNVDIGLRMSYTTPFTYLNGDAAAFVPSLYDAANAPALIVPRCVGDALATPPHDCGSSTNRRGMNPITGALVPSALIGTYAPNSGNVTNGMVTALTPGYKEGFFNSTGFQAQPRLGFAWDVFGNASMAVRGSFAVTKNTLPSNGQLASAGNANPPNQFNPQVVYGNLSTLGAGGSSLAPSNLTAWDRDYKVPTVYQWSLGVQKQLPQKLFMEVNYVGNQVRHLLQQLDINTLPYGKRFANIDPTTGLPLPDNFLRPYPGYGTIFEDVYNGNSNYNALQSQLHRRVTTGLQLGVAYTWSKAMDFQSGPGLMPLYIDQQRLYGRCTCDQSHVFTFNYVYSLPRASRLIDNGFVRRAFDDWHLSGITNISAGFPLTITSATPGRDLTGGGEDNNGSLVNQRPQLVGPVALSRGDRSAKRWFATENVTAPALGSYGNAPKDPIRGPGFNSWDMSIYKDFPLGEKGRVIQFRWEAYNVFNHTQFATINTAASFNTTGAQTNTQFGQVTAYRDPRVMQGSLRFAF